VGVFDRFLAGQFPVERDPFAIYFKLAGLNGRYELRLQIIGPDLQTVVADIELADALASADPLATTDVIVGVPALDLPAPGRYSVRLRYNGLLADEISFLAERLP